MNATSAKRPCISWRLHRPGNGGWYRLNSGGSWAGTRARSGKPGESSRVGAVSVLSACSMNFPCVPAGPMTATGGGHRGMAKHGMASMNQPCLVRVRVRLVRRWVGGREGHRGGQLGPRCGWGQGHDQNIRGTCRSKREGQEGPGRARATAHWKINTKSVLLLLHFAANQTARSG
jgi:hypothetical protein